MSLVPDAVFYLKIHSAKELVDRVLSSGRGFDYWESGMDLHLGEDFYDSFIAYQTRMLQVFDRMSVEYGFHELNASRSVRSVAADLRRSVTKVIDEPSISEKLAQHPAKTKPSADTAGKREPPDSQAQLKKTAVR
jgi:hypothetical protein